MGTRRISSCLSMPLLAASVCLATAAFAGPAAATPPNRAELASGSATSRAGYSVAGPTGAEWSLPGGARLRAAPGAELRILNTPQPLSLTDGHVRPAYTVVVKAGRVDVSIDETSTSAVVFALPRRLNAIVERGSATALASRGVAAIGNTTGVVRTAINAGAFQPLSTGMMHVATAAKNEVRARVAPPSKITGNTVVLSPAASAEISGIDWQSVDRATAYRAELVTGDNQVIRTDETSKTSLGTFHGVEHGQYKFRVYSIDSNGMDSGVPVEAPVRVVGIELPPGAYVDGTGTMRLAEDQKVRLIGVEGLEMTYGAAGHYLRAHDAVSLYNNEETVVHVGLPGSSAFATARLAPRTVEARVELGPQSATWPKDPIRIRVRIEDPTGKPIPTSIEATPRVLVGVRQVNVPFTRKGEWLEGTLSPQSGSGPWVVRVEVTDQFGLPLGREHLEVVAN